MAQTTGFLRNFTARTDPRIFVEYKFTTCRHTACIIIFGAALFKIAENWKPPKCPSAGEWNKQIVVYSYNEIIQ